MNIASVQDTALVETLVHRSAYYLSHWTLVLYRGRVVEMAASEEVFNNPLHPYTEMLMTCVPQLESKWEGGRGSARGKAPRAAGRLPYSPRCPTADAALGCLHELPELIEVANDHYVACLRYR